MKKTFNITGSSPADAEQALQEWGVRYERGPGGIICVHGNIRISNKGLTRLPDLSSVYVSGSFHCQGNALTSLEGAPWGVSRDFCCDHNQLTSLKGAPRLVGGGFYCQSNQITSLTGAPLCTGDFFCSHNLLTSLEHAPPVVGGSFYCIGNKLGSLEHAPETFESIVSDFGAFSTWDAVPNELRTMQERADAATVLQAPMKISRPLALRGRTNA